ncbi:MAG: transcriptional regulator [Proteobacteria bacterium]|nr:MAG: transcriptional regulator [Pseudomonadota bacterium]
MAKKTVKLPTRPKRDVAAEILEGMNQALAFAKGEADVSHYRIHVPRAVDVRAIRSRLGMSQAMFAKTFAVEKRTLQDWEQGRREPQGPARVLLTLIDREPQAVMRALMGGG